MTDGRIERLERRVRRLRAEVLLLALAVFGAAVLGAAKPGPRRVEAREFWVVDAKGKAVGFFGTSEGVTRLRIGPEGGQARVLASLSEDGTATVSVTAAEGEAFASLVSAAGAGPGVVVVDEKGRHVASLP